MADFTMFCEIAEEEERVTPALLIPLEMYAREIGFFDHLVHLQLDMKEVKHTVLGKAVTQILNIAISSPYNKDIDTELRPDRQAANVVGQEQFPDQSGINRFLRRFTPMQIEDLTLIHGLTLRQYGEVIAHLLDPGNVPPRSRFYDLYYQVLDNLDGAEIILLFRFDGGITSGEIIEFLIDEGQLVISKGNNSRTSRRLARRANNDAWEWVSPNQQANDLGWIKIPHCRHRVRVIVLRTFRCDKVVYSHLILNIPAEVLSVKEAVDLYNARQTVESMIKESRRVLWIGHLRTGHYWGLQAFVAFGFLAHNLLTWFQRDVFGNTGLGDLGLKRFVQDFMRLPAQVQKVGRTIRIKLLVAHADARALVTAIASINARKFGRQLGLPLIWGHGFRGAKPTLHPMSLGP